MNLGALFVICDYFISSLPALPASTADMGEVTKYDDDTSLLLLHLLLLSATWLPSVVHNISRGLHL